MSRAIVGISANLEFAMAAPPSSQATKVVTDVYNLTAAGTSLNVARALVVNRVPVTALVLGAEDLLKAVLQTYITAQGLDAIIVSARQKTPVTGIMEDRLCVGEPLKLCAKPPLLADALDPSALVRFEALITHLLPEGGLRIATGVKPEELPFTERLLFTGSTPEQFRVLNPSLLLVNRCRSEFVDLARRVNLVVMNHEEAEKYLGIAHGFNKADMEGLRSLCENVLVTWAGNGSLLYWQGRLYSTRAQEVKVVDPTGAGDCYLGYFLAEAVVRNRPVDEAMQIASAASAIQVQHWGANHTPRPDEVRALLSAASV